MREYKASTKRGQALISTGERCCWSSLHNLYESWSEAKQKAFDWCWEQYANDNQSTALELETQIVSVLLVVGYAIKDGENIMTN